MIEGAAPSARSAAFEAALTRVMDAMAVDLAAGGLAAAQAAAC